MVVNVFFSPDEIRSFFTENGFLVIQSTFGRWVQGYHGKLEWVDYVADAVVIDTRQVEASKLFEKVTEYRLKRMLAPTSLEMSRVIEKTFKSIVNGK